MLVWRVEHRKSRVGPYTHGSYKEGTLRKTINNAHGYDEIRRGKAHLHPTPSQDRGIYSDDFYEFKRNNPDFNCGFISIQQLKSWFARWLRKLNQKGFVIRTFEVDGNECLVGQKQVVFSRKGRRALKTFGVLQRGLDARKNEI